MMEFDYDDAMSGLICMLSPDDAELLLKTAREISPKVIVELGACTGCSSTVLGLVAKENSGHLYSVEPLPQRQWHENMHRLGLDDSATLIEAYSPWLTTEQMALIPMPIDYLLVDAEHHTKSCLTDYQFWQHYVRVGGRIAFHDWCGAGPLGYQIQRAVEIILETDDLSEVGRVEGPTRGTIVFEKRG